MVFLGFFSFFIIRYFVKGTEVSDIVWGTSSFLIFVIFLIRTKERGEHYVNGLYYSASVEKK